MGIGGTKRKEYDEIIKKVGLFIANVVAINPDAEQYKELTGIELEEDSKTLEYTGESRDGNPYVRIDVWVESIGPDGQPTGDHFKINFFLEDKERENKDNTKKQYINSVGSTSWCDDPNNLPEWFAERPYRLARSGEEELYNFVKSWLNLLDYRSEESVLELDWKKLMRGDVSELQSQINGEWSGPFGALATVSTKEKDGEVREYQSVFNKAFFPAKAIQHFRLIDYSKEEVIQGLQDKKSKKLRAHERFVLNVTGDYGCKDFYVLEDLKEYDPSENIVATDEPMTEHGSDY